MNTVLDVLFMARMRGEGAEASFVFEGEVIGQVVVPGTWLSFPAAHRGDARYLCLQFSAVADRFRQCFQRRVTAELNERYVMKHVPPVDVVKPLPSATPVDGAGGLQLRCFARNVVESAALRRRADSDLLEAPPGISDS
jgi:hypothetical protein